MISTVEKIKKEEEGGWWIKMLNKVVSEGLSEKGTLEQRLIDICGPLSLAGVSGQRFSAV